VRGRRRCARRGPGLRGQCSAASTHTDRAPSTRDDLDASHAVVEGAVRRVQRTALSVKQLLAGARRCRDRRCCVEPTPPAPQAPPACRPPCWMVTSQARSHLLIESAVRWNGRRLDSSRTPRPARPSYHRTKARRSRRRCRHSISRDDVSVLIGGTPDGDLHPTPSGAPLPLVRAGWGSRFECVGRLSVVWLLHSESRHPHDECRSAQRARMEGTKSP